MSIYSGTCTPLNYFKNNFFQLYHSYYHSMEVTTNNLTRFLKRGIYSTILFILPNNVRKLSNFETGTVQQFNNNVIYEICKWNRIDEIELKLWITSSKIEYSLFSIKPRRELTHTGSHFNQSILFINFLHIMRDKM